MEIKNPIWRLNNLYKVVDKSGRKVSFKQNNVQKLLNDSKEKRKRILKARQMGVSTNELLKMLDYVLFNKNKTACILAHEQDSIQKLFRIVRRAYEFIPEELKPKLDKGGGSQYAMYFPEINSRIYCDLESRGDTIHWLHISEKAFIEDLNRVYATTEAVPIDGIITEESTPNGMNHFYDSWMDLDSNYKNVFFPWYLMEEYTIENHTLTNNQLTENELKLIKYAKSKYKIDLSLGQIAFRRFKQRELKDLFKQEYPEDDISCFLTTGNSPFNLEIIKPMYDSAVKPIEIINGIKIYEHKIPNEIYVVAADTSEGVNGDASAAHVFKVSNREQVAVFSSNKIKPSDFAEKLEEIAKLYSGAWPGALLCVERNNHGHAVLLKLDEVLQYPNLFRTKKENKKKDFDEMKLGWLTDRITRPLMLDILIEGVENGSVILNDKETLGECLTLINNDGKLEAEEGKHDDNIMAAAISVMMCIEESKLSVYDNIASKIKI
jgi:hypothetical protein